MEFYDLDGTICESRQIISDKMKKKLLIRDEFVVISGAEVERIKKQMDGVPCIIMGQNGNDAPNWENKLNEEEKKEILEHLEKISRFCNIPIDNKTVHHRGCQISLSFTGHNADVKWKKRFDPLKKYRNFVLKKIPFKSKILVVRVAGTTCLDYNRKGNLKGDNLKRYMKLSNLKKSECVYYGDNFGKGGNDESVLGIMKCIKVDSPDDLYKKLC